MKPIIFTIGHSTHSLDEFVQILQAYNIERLIDIRTIPRSRHNPQFNKENFSIKLRNRRINYRHMKKLGGLRHTTAESPNTAWRNKSFRGFADYLSTKEFEQGLDELIELAQIKTTVIMCAEALPWRCHRFLIADVLVAKGFPVKHIMSKTAVQPHKLSSMAIVQSKKLIYPASPSQSLQISIPD